MFYIKVVAGLRITSAVFKDDVVHLHLNIINLNFPVRAQTNNSLAYKKLIRKLP